MDELPPSIRRQEISGESADTRGMNTLDADVEFSADGSLKLLSPLPEWLKSGRAHVLLSVPNGVSPKPKRLIPTATPEMLAKRAAAFEAVRKLNPYRDITDPVAWQREIREDVVLPGARAGCLDEPFQCGGGECDSD